MRAQLTLDLRQVTAPEVLADRLLDALHLARIVHVCAHPELGLQRDFWEAVVTRHGLQVSVDENALTGEPTGALWSDVEFDPATPNVFRYSSSAQPLHTDGSYISDPPEFVFLICQRAAQMGGATVFLDGDDLFDMLSSEAPDLLRELIATPLRFMKGGGVVESPCLIGERTRLILRWNYYALDRGLSIAHRSLAGRLQSLLLAAMAQRRTRNLLLRPGEAVFFSDARVLHGREAFVAQRRGDRCLWKGGMGSQTAQRVSAIA